jgi:Protein of unknown function (DUF3617)
MWLGTLHSASAAAMTVAAILFSQPASAQPLSAQPGLWKIEASSGGLRVPITQCVTAKDMAEPQRVAKVFGHPFNPMTSRRPDPGFHTLAEQVQQTCDYSDVTESSDSLTFKYRCKGSFGSTEDGSLKFDTPTHYSGVFNFVGDEEMDVRPASPTVSTEGSRVGDCTDSTIDGAKSAEQPFR